MEVPAEVREAACGLFRTHVPGRALLPPLDPEAVENRQGPEGTRRLEFACDDLHVAVEAVSEADGLVHLTVALSPPEEVLVELEHPVADLSLAVRGVPPLRLAAAPGGLVRLVITAHEEAEAVRRQWQTAWTRL